MATRRSEELSLATQLAFHQSFMSLKQEEDRLIQQGGSREPSRAYVIHGPAGKFSGWIEGAATESLAARSELLATQFGRALHPPAGTGALEHFLHCLYLDLRATHSQHLGMDTGTAAFIEDLLEASSLYTARLQCQQLDAPEEITASDKEDTPTALRRQYGPKADYETAIRVAEIVSDIVPEGHWQPHVEEICRELDEQSIPCPNGWRQKQIRTWDGGLTDRVLVEKAIAYRLKVAAKYRKMTLA